MRKFWLIGLIFVLAGVISCDINGSNKPEKKRMTRVGTITIRFEIVPEGGWSTEEGDFPQCQRGLKLLPDNSLSTKETTTSREVGCVSDIVYNRDCSEIRLEGQYRVDILARQYECTDGAPVFMHGPEFRKKLDDFSRVWRIGDCNDVIEDYQRKMKVIESHLKCNEKGRLVFDKSLIDSELKDSDIILTQKLDLFEYFKPEPKGGWSTEEGDFPQCQRGLKRLERDYVLGNIITSLREFECAWDAMYTRNCREIRLEGEYRISDIVHQYECTDGVPVYSHDRDSLIELYDFSRVWRFGDCNDVIGDYSSRLNTIKRRLKCDDEGNPYEDYDCWGCEKGGRYFNPCGGGMC